MIVIMSDVWSEVFSHALDRSLERGASVFRRDDRVLNAYYVREGTVVLVRALADGGTLTLHQAQPGSLLADASLFAERYHCDAICDAPTRIAVLPRAIAIKALEKNGLALVALSKSAHEVQALRARLEVMRVKTLRARLDAFLDLHGTPEAGGWVRVADWLGVTPAALYRELARRRRRNLT